MKTNNINILIKYFFLTTFIVLTSCSSQLEPNVKEISKKEASNLKISPVQNDTNHNKLYSQQLDTSKQSQEKHSDFEPIPNFDANVTDSLVMKNKQKPKKQIIVKGGKIKISVEDIPLNEFIDLCFGNFLELNYTVSEAVSKIKKPVTLNMSSLQKKQKVFEVIKKILSLNGVGVTETDGVLYIEKLKAQKSMMDESSLYVEYGRTVDPKIDDDLIIIQFIPYYYITPKNVQYILRRVGSNVNVYTTPDNIQFLKGTASDVRDALRVITLVDRPYMKDKEFYLVELQNIDVNKFVKNIKNIFAMENIAISTKPNSTGVLISPIEDINSIVVVSPKRSWFERILYWKKKLDIVSEGGPQERFYTYKVKNRSAEDLAKMLNSVIDMKLSTVKKVKPKQKTETANDTEIINTKTQNTSNSSTKIVADKTTNQLMMKLSPADYRELLPTIQSLDALPLQVLAEVTLAEVTLTDTFSLGFEYGLRNAAASTGKSSVIPIEATLGGTGLVATYASKALDIAVNAFASNKELNILSKPKLLILNNETANMSVGSQIPVVTSENSTSDNIGILRNIEYRDTGIVIGLTPTINSNGVLTLAVNITLSEAQLNDTSNIDSPLIVNRSLTTTLTVNDGETVLLGGLISHNKSTSDGGVPFLIDIPWLGELFKTQSKTTVKTELIMLIKPTIINNPTKLNKNTHKIKSLLKLLEKNSLV